MRISDWSSDVCSSDLAFGAVDAEIRDMWDLEKEAQAAAFDAVQPGAPCESVDAAARRVLERAGLGPDYRLPGLDRKSVVSGKSVSVRVDLGGRRIIKKKKRNKHKPTTYTKKHTQESTHRSNPTQTHTT